MKSLLPLQEYEKGAAVYPFSHVKCVIVSGNREEKQMGWIHLGNQNV